MSEGERQVVTFKVADETYGVGISDVQEIIPMLPVNRVPRTPAWIEGLVDLRGTILPVLDLRRRFGLPDAPDSPTRCIVIVDVRDQTIGLVVDAVRDVTRLSDLSPVPPATGVRDRFLSAIARIPDGARHALLMLLDLDSLLNEQEIVELATQPGESPSSAPS